MGAAPWDAGWGIQNEKSIAQYDRLLLVYQIQKDIAYTLPLLALSFAFERFHLQLIFFAWD